MDYKEIVKSGYDNCFKAYSDARAGSNCFEVKELKKLLEHGSKVLDIGCGDGVPILLELKDKCEIHGVDISSRQIEQAKVNFEDGTFLNRDIMEVEYDYHSFDAIISFYTLFHIKREFHEKLFIKMNRWLKIGGYLLCTVSDTDDGEYTENDFFGVEMFWSNYGLSTYLEFCSKNGFEILKTDTIGHGYNSEYLKEEECHPYILAKKIDEI